MNPTPIRQELNKIKLTEAEARREQIILERYTQAAKRQQEKLSQQDEDLRQKRRVAHLVRQKESTKRQQALIGAPKRRFYISPEGREMWELVRETLKKGNTDTVFAELMAMYAAQAVNPHLPITPLHDEDTKKAPFIWLRMSPSTRQQWTALLAALCQQHPSFQHHEFTDAPSRALQVQGMSYLCQLHLENATTPA